MGHEPLDDFAEHGTRDRREPVEQTTTTEDVTVTTGDEDLSAGDPVTDATTESASDGSGDDYTRTADDSARGL